MLYKYSRYRFLFLVKIYEEKNWIGIGTLIVIRKELAGSARHAINTSNIRLWEFYCLLKYRYVVWPFFFHCQHKMIKWTQLRFLYRCRYPAEVQYRYGCGTTGTRYQVPVVGIMHRQTQESGFSDRGIFCSLFYQQEIVRSLSPLILSLFYPPGAFSLSHSWKWICLEMGKTARICNEILERRAENS